MTLTDVLLLIIIGLMASYMAPGIRDIRWRLRSIKARIGGRRK